MTCPLCDALLHIAAGTHPRHVATLDHCEVILHDNQVCYGWCVLITKHHAEHAAALPEDVELAIAAEAARVGRALRAVFSGSGANTAPPRINYANLGNVVPHIHWHVVPRHATGPHADPDPHAVPWNLPAVALDPNAIDTLRARLAAAILVTTARP
jgi:diadenosine tetraphosphate (Ap4A) HIT family hydrolase